MTNTVFEKGQAVVLFKGSNVGTPGIFVGLREDRKWANIEEEDGTVRQHPVEWLKPADI